MKVPQLTATLASRGLGTKDEPLLRLDQVLHAEAEEGADFEFPAGFSADGRLLVERLDLTHLPGVARRPLFKILVALFQAVDPSHGSHDEQLGRAAAWAKELRQKAGLPLLKRDRSRDQDLSTFAATVVSDIHRALGTDDDENTLALALAAALGPPALVQPGGGAGSALGGGVDPNPMQDTYMLDEGGILGGSHLAPVLPPSLNESFATKGAVARCFKDTGPVNAEDNFVVDRTAWQPGEDTNAVAHC